MFHPTVLLSVAGRICRRQMSILLSARGSCSPFTPPVQKKQTTLSFAPAAISAPAPVASAEGYDDGMEELLLDSIAAGVHEILTEPLTAREVNEHVTKLLRKGGLSYRQQQDLDLLKMYTTNISKEGEWDLGGSRHLERCSGQYQKPQTFRPEIVRRL